MTESESGEAPAESLPSQPWPVLVGDTLALVALAIPLAAAPLAYPYHYYHRLWYVTSEAAALGAGALAVVWALASLAFGGRRAPRATVPDAGAVGGGAGGAGTADATWVGEFGDAALPARSDRRARPGSAGRRALLLCGLGYAAVVAWALYENGRAVWSTKAWSEWWFIVASGLLAYAVHRFSGREGLFFPIVAAVLAGPVLVSLLGLDQYLLMHDWSTREVTRIWSSTGNANTLSGYLAPALPLAIATAYAVRRRQRYLLWAVSLAIATAILLSYTRGGWYSIGAAVVVLALMLDRRIILAMIAFLVVASAVFPGVAHRATSAFAPEASVSFEQRLQLWWTAYYMWRDHPVAGVGTGSYSTLIPEYVARHPEIDRGLRNREPHNSYLKALAEQGAVGFVLLFGTLLVGWWAVIREWRRSRAGPRKALLAGVVAAALAVALHSGTNSVLHDFRSALDFWAVAGLGLRLAAMEDDDPALDL